MYSMKKQYGKPKLTSYGNVEAITQFFGSSSQSDFLFFPGNSNPVTDASGNPITSEGSSDGVIKPNAT
jgi:hypothetical protein